ncbi:hypothetical protein AMAG_09324 [Allomyces macrogynus ATCC 38327]|uniref:Uncharacterized protein n=1 Tax=Allomyces macrogynus (strain ATCC 38327) TaxID=578462 RepID=A0A0L0SPG6_ALLM3|nr:hypothetical protein AMAG_09324 [Allomyces macrogynus ATCC 38327]|eukprot:KNE64294.1 hypothetical protein AMAG_09324 [Allomyces macrogynus ATCC 38327]
MPTTFLGGPLVASFTVMPDRPLTDLLIDPFLQLISLYLVYRTYASLEKPSDMICYGFLVVNRAVTLFDTLMVLFIDNLATDGLIYFSLARSLVRHLALAVAMAYILQRRLVRISQLVTREQTQLLSYLAMGFALTAAVVDAAIVVAFFVSGVRVKTLGEEYLVKRPRATASELAQFVWSNVSDVPPELWQILQVVVIPTVHMINFVCDIFFYTIVSGLWSTTFINVRKLSTKRWLDMSWPYMILMVLHFNVFLITLLSRTILRRASLGFIMELGQFTVAMDWFIFFRKTKPLLEDVVAVEEPATPPSPDRSSPQFPARAGGRPRTVYYKNYQQPTDHLVASDTTAVYPPPEFGMYETADIQKAPPPRPPRAMDTTMYGSPAPSPQAGWDPRYAPPVPQQPGLMTPPSTAVTRSPRGATGPPPPRPPRSAKFDAIEAWAHDAAASALPSPAPTATGGGSYLPPPTPTSYTPYGSASTNDVPVSSAASGGPPPPRRALAPGSSNAAYSASPGGRGSSARGGGGGPPVVATAGYGSAAYGPAPPRSRVPVSPAPSSSSSRPVGPPPDMHAQQERRRQRLQEEQACEEYLQAQAAQQQHQQRQYVSPVGY